MTTSGGLDRTFREEALPHLSAVYRFALRLAGDPERAQDLTQETFLRAYRGFEGYSAGTNAKSWLFTICRNTFLREEERGRRHEQIVRAEAEGDPRALSREAVVFKAAQELDPEGTFWSRIVDEELVREIDSLPAGFREAVVLSDVEGLSYQEMAELMEVPVGTVKSRLFRGRRILQERLYEYAVSTGRIEKRTDAPPGNPEGKCR